MRCKNCKKRILLIKFLMRNGFCSKKCKEAVINKEKLSLNMKNNNDDFDFKSIQYDFNLKHDDYSISPFFQSGITGNALTDFYLDEMDDYYEFCLLEENGEY